MARTREYHHFCPVARSLEVIGEKWSLLIVRDLLRGPQRFTDLLRYLGGITPKWLTLRLRDLEEAGIVERDHRAGRREVWYRLTPKGEELAPVITGLAVWGLDHAMRPPLPGEPVHPERAMTTVTLFRNKRRIRLPEPSTWAIRFTNDGPWTIRFDGDRWSYQRGDAEANVTVTATTEDWVIFLTVPPEERPERLAALAISGDPAHVAAFLQSFGVEAPRSVSV